MTQLADPYNVDNVCHGLHSLTQHVATRQVHTHQTKMLVDRMKDLLGYNDADIVLSVLVLLSELVSS